MSKYATILYITKKHGAYMYVVLIMSSQISSPTLAGLTSSLSIAQQPVLDPTRVLVDFGKRYRDRPLSELLADTQHVKWLRDQPWFLHKLFVYQSIAGLPTHDNHRLGSGLHNKMQACFLDPAFRDRFVRAVPPPDFCVGPIKGCTGYILEPRYNSDVELCCQVETYDESGKLIPFLIRLFVELKPAIEDAMEILRQIRAQKDLVDQLAMRPDGDKIERYPVLYALEYKCPGFELAQVREIFAQWGVAIVMDDQINSPQSQ